jgi:hypothetical protein
MHPVDPRQSCRHEAFRVPRGGDRTVCADCGTSATDAVVHTRAYADTLEREIAIAVSEIGTIAGELERLASDGARGVDHAQLAERLRRIAFHLDKAQPLP